MKVRSNKVREVEEPKIYDKDRLYFEYLDRNQFEDAEIEEEEVYGEINLDKPFDGDYEEEVKKRSIDVIRIPDRKDDTAKLYEIFETKEKHHKKAIGYIQTEIEDMEGAYFIRVMKGGGLLIPLWFWWLLLIGGAAMVFFSISIATVRPELPVIILIAKSAYASIIQKGIGIAGVIAMFIGFRKIDWDKETGTEATKPNTKSDTGKVAINLWNTLAIAISIFTIIGISVMPMRIEPERKDTDTETQTQLEFADGDDWDGKLPERYNDQTTGAEYIEIAGYTNLLVTADHQNIELVNTSINTVYQQYIITFNDEQLFDSKLIAPGKQVEWNAFEQLPEGKHEVQFHINTYDIKTQAPCNGANQIVSVEVKK